MLTGLNAMPPSTTPPKIPDLQPSSQTDTNSLADDIAYFRKIPLALSTFSDVSFTTRSISRTLSDPNGPSPGHSLMASTWNSDATIPRLLSMYRSGTPNSTGSGPELRRFYTLGNGLNSHPKLLHGGVLSTLLDSTMSNLAGFALQEYLATKGEDAEGSSVVTAQLNVGFLKGVRTPGTVRVRSWVKEGGIVEGNDGRGLRKVWIEGVVESDQIPGVGEGAVDERDLVVHARAEGLWLRIRVDGGKDKL